MWDKLKRIHFSYYLPILIIPAFLVFTFLNSSIHNCIVKNTTGKTIAAQLPYKSQDTLTGAFSISFDFNASFLFSGKILLIPDDCVKEMIINNKVVPFSFFKNAQCSYSTGMELDLENFIHPGKNKVQFQMENRGGYYSLYFKDRTYYDLYLLFIALILCIPIAYRHIKKSLSLSDLWSRILNYRFKKRYFVSIAGLILLMFSMKGSNFFITALANENNHSYEAPLPYTFEGKEQAMMNYRIEFYNNIFSPDTIHIIPDDCITSFRINNYNAMDLLDPGKICDWKDGVHISNCPYLIKGKNVITLSVLNKGGVGGINFIYNSPLALTVIILSFLMMLFPIFLSLKNNIKYGKISAFLLIVPVFFWFVYWYRYSYTSYGYDIDYGHIPYIKYVFSTLSVPYSLGGWSFYHPSLYYILASFSWFVSSLFGETSMLFMSKASQILSMALYCIFVYYAFRLIWIVFKNFALNQNINTKGFTFNFSLIITYLIVLFWPSGIVIAPRIGNDSALVPFFTAALFYFVSYLENKKNLHFIIALLFSVLALWSKANGILLFGIFGLSLLIQNKFKFYDISFIKKIIVIFTFVVVGVFIGMNEKINSKESADYISNAAHLPKNLIISNDVENFFTFDFKTFIDEPFTSTKFDKYGRQMFWYFLIKTSLFGEYRFTQENVEFTAQALSILILCMLTFLLISIVLLCRNFFHLHPLYLWIVFSVISLIAFRLAYPYACSGDFRYVYHIIIPLSVLYGLFLSSLKNKIIKTLVFSVTVLFLIGSLLFQYAIVFG